jgi:hypothetical protein
LADDHDVIIAEVHRVAAIVLPNHRTQQASIIRWETSEPVIMRDSPTGVFLDADR